MKKQFKRILAVILSIAIIFSMASALGTISFAQEDILKYLTYEINNGTVTITGIDSDISGDIVFPDTIEGYPVELVDCLFSECDRITSITIGDCDVVLDAGCFFGCSQLKSITIGNGDVFVSEWFSMNEYTGLESITLGNGMAEFDYSMLVETDFYKNEDNWVDGVLYIGNNLIKAKENITECTIKEGTVLIGDNAFEYCENLKNVVIPDSVVSIGDYAFSDCYSLRDVIIPDNVTYIGECAFQNCSGIERINIPDKVIDIGESAFLKCYGLQRITVGENNPFFSSDEYGVLFDKDKTTLIQYPTGNIRAEYEIPDGVINIGDRAFSLCDSLINVKIPDSVTHIGYSSFSECNGIKNIIIPDSVVTIDNSAFSLCSSLIDIVIPGSVTCLGEYAFAYCEKLINITIPDSLTDIGKLAFDDTAYYRDENNWTDDVLYVGNCLVDAKYEITSCNIREGTTTICSEAFDICPELKDITIPDSVISIGSNAFSGTAYYEDKSNWEDGFLYIDNCLVGAEEEIENCYIKEGTVLIADDVFFMTSCIYRVRIPSSLKYFDNFLDDGNFDLISIIVDENNEYFSSDDYGVLFNKDKTVLIRYPSGIGRTVYEIPESVKIIDDYAFNYSELVDIVIPEGVEYIGNYAFADNRNLKDVAIPSSVRSMGNSVFYYCSELENIEFNTDNITIGDNAFGYCHNLEKIVLGQENTIIGEGPFEECNFLKTVVYGNGQTRIYENEFLYCEELNKVFIPETITHISAFSFFFTTRLTDIYYGGSEADWEKIAIDCGNGRLDSVTIHFNSKPEDVPEKPTTPPEEPTTPPEGPTTPPEEPTTPPEEPTTPPEKPTTPPEKPTTPPEKPTTPPEKPTTPPEKPDKPAHDHELYPHENSGIHVTDHGVDLKPGMSPDDIRKGVENEKIDVLSPDGKDLGSGSLVGTGCIIQVCDADGNILSQYEVCVDSDVNGDGKISAADARIALRTAASIDIINGVYAIASDTNGDGRITAADARVILRRAAGLDKNEPQVVAADFNRMADLLTNMFGVEFDYSTADTAYVVDYIIHDELFIWTYDYYFGEDSYDFRGDSNHGIYTDPLGKIMFYYKLPVENVRWICEEVYQVQFDENYISTTGDSYYYDGYVYVEFAQAGYGCLFDTEIDEYKLIDDGKYEIIASYYILPYGYIEDGLSPELQCRLKVVAEWKQIDGKYDWVFYSVEHIVSPDFDRMSDLLTDMIDVEFDYKTADTAYVVDYIIHDKFL